MSTKQEISFKDFCRNDVKPFELYVKTGKDEVIVTKTTITKIYEIKNRKRGRELVNKEVTENEKISRPKFELFGDGITVRDYCNQFLNQSEQKEQELTNSIQSRNTALAATAPTVTLAGTGLGLAIPKLLSWAKLLFAK